MQQPLVSIICLCYNHEKFVAEAIQSVLLQTYKNIELIIVDDASTDSSSKIIEDVLDGVNVSSLTEKTKNDTSGLQIPPVFIQNSTNMGNCRAFNMALNRATGKYIIDLAADDVLLDDRVEKQVKAFEQLDEQYVVVFSNAVQINEKGEVLGYHYPIDKAGKSKQQVPQGDVYKNVLQGYFINTASMMMRTKVLRQIGGYDETLSYEDFDFWVRTARHYLYHYLDEVTTMKRVVRNSLSSKFYLKNNNDHLRSTLKVCYNALEQNTTNEENKLLAIQASYYLRQSYYLQHFDLVEAYHELLKKLNYRSKLTQFFVFLSQYRIKVFRLYRLYLKLRQWAQRRIR